MEYIGSFRACSSCVSQIGILSFISRLNFALVCCILYSITILFHMSILRFLRILKIWTREKAIDTKGGRPKSRLILRITLHPRERMTAVRVAEKFGSYRASIVVVRIVTLVAHIRHQTTRNTPKAPVGAGYWGPLITLSLGKIFNDQTPRGMAIVSMLKCGSLDNATHLFKTTSEIIIFN